MDVGGRMVLNNGAPCRSCGGWRTGVGAVETCLFVADDDEAFSHQPKLNFKIY
jgi:hypothetical protein